MSDDQRKEITVSSMESRMCCPSPVRSRAKSAAEIACATAKPVSLSGRMVRTSAGRRSSLAACTVVRPESDCTSGSNTGLCAYGPVSPNPEIEA